MTCRCCIRNGKHRVYKTGLDVFPVPEWVVITPDGCTAYHGTSWDQALATAIDGAYSNREEN
ncbi:hypothetical protein [Streptomyces sp. NPDC058280]|uniref:hypothetical protein n=1 Tax=Streptomyces sp. NPDC058280 TaxID=3346419 RepID=UPI0036EB2A4F